MTMKCKFQMTCNPSNINHFEKKTFWERDSAAINQNINTIPQKAKKPKKVVWTWRDN